MLTINIMKLEVNTINNIGSLNIGRSIICHNRAVSKEISSTGIAAAPESTIATAAPGIPPTPEAVTPPTPIIPPTP